MYIRIPSNPQHHQLCHLLSGRLKGYKAQHLINLISFPGFVSTKAWLQHQKSSATEFGCFQADLVPTTYLSDVAYIGNNPPILLAYMHMLWGKCIPILWVRIYKRLYRTSFISCMTLTSLSICKRREKHNYLDCDLKIAFHSSDDTITFATIRSRIHVLTDLDIIFHISNIKAKCA